MISLLTFAQVRYEIKKGPIQEAGQAAGFSIGVVHSYRYWPQKIGIQTTILPVLTSYYNYFSIGLKGFHKFHESESTRFFVYLSNSINSA